jgi:putative ABC transport system substrate-binding protein
MALVGGAAAVSPLRAVAQLQPSKVWRVAYVYPENLDATVDQVIFEAFREELKQLGYIEGKNLVINTWFARGDVRRIPSLMSEALALHPNAIVAVGTPTVIAARNATSTVPIVMSPGGDPVRSGLVTSLARPGANITGLADLNADTLGKLIELIHLVVPVAKRIAVLLSSNPIHQTRYELTERAAKSLGLVTVPIIALTPSDLDSAFDKMAQENCHALFVLSDPTRPAIVTLAAKMRMPSFYQLTTYVELGGLASYGANLTALFRKTAQYVSKILAGAAPADLPVEQPVIFDFVLNLETATTLGLTISDAVLARVDRVIE